MDNFNTYDLAIIGGGISSCVFVSSHIINGFNGRIAIIENSQYSGSLIWLSETLIDFTYSDNIFYFSNENSDQKFEKSYYVRDFDKLKFITYLTQRNKSMNKIL